MSLFNILYHQGYVLQFDPQVEWTFFFSVLKSQPQYLFGVFPGITDRFSYIMNHICCILNVKCVIQEMISEVIEASLAFSLFVADVI